LGKCPSLPPHFFPCSLRAQPAGHSCFLPPYVTLSRVPRCTTGSSVRQFVIWIPLVRRYRPRCPLSWVLPCNNFLSLLALSFRISLSPRFFSPQMPRVEFFFCFFSNLRFPQGASAPLILVRFLRVFSAPRNPLCKFVHPNSFGLTFFFLIG